MDTAIHDDFARSFRAKLYLRAESRTLPLRLSRSFDGFSWGLTPEDDWLQAGGDAQDSFIMDFHFLGSTEDRLHYDITIPGPPKTVPGPPTPKKLGISLNGYLGFYWHSEVTDLWKIDPVRITNDGLICYLRDHQGHRVGVTWESRSALKNPVGVMNVLDGEVCSFLLVQST